MIWALGGGGGYLLRNGAEADDVFDGVGDGHVELGEFFLRHQNQKAGDGRLGVVGQRPLMRFLCRSFAEISADTDLVRW